MAFAGAGGSDAAGLTEARRRGASCAVSCARERPEARRLRDPMTTSPEFANWPRNHRMDFIFLARRAGTAPELSARFPAISTAFFLCVSFELPGKRCGDFVNKALPL